jgi:ABC-type glutathione transport system ATPase component
MRDGDAIPLLEMTDIVREFELVEGRGAIRVQRKRLAACDHVDLDIQAGEILSLVGESGSGKSTLARIAVMLDRPDSGSVRFEGDELTTMSAGELRRRRRDFQTVFQDPLSSLNPRWRIGRSIARPLEVHGVAAGDDARARVEELLELVELPAAAARRFPHELSGGQRQRACIARAVALRPKLLVADEAISALDVSTQAAILELFRSVRDTFGTAILFIAHDLRTVRHLSDRVAVMRQGKIVELREVGPLFDEPRDPYTKRLIDDVLKPRYQPPQEVLDA